MTAPMRSAATNGIHLRAPLLTLISQGYRELNEKFCELSNFATCNFENLNIFLRFWVKTARNCRYFNFFTPNSAHPDTTSPTPPQPAAPNNSTVSCCSKDSAALSTSWLAPSQYIACGAHASHCSLSQTHARLSLALSNTLGSPTFDDHSMTWCGCLYD